MTPTIKFGDADNLSPQGEIVKRILYNNPDAEFIFCAGDDKVIHLPSSERSSMSLTGLTPIDRRRHVPRAPALPGR